MTLHDFYNYIGESSVPGEKQIPDLKVLVERYPWFSPARILLLKAYKETGSIHTQSAIQKTVIYTGNPRSLYFYLHPEEKINEFQHKRDNRFSGNYFDLLQMADNSTEGRENSLKKMAEKLKLSRSIMSPVKKAEKKQHSLPEREINVPVVDYFQIQTQKSELDAENLELKYKQLIREKNYKEALEILKHLNLINPKKSVYFADQIRFLEKVLNIQKN